MRVLPVAHRRPAKHLAPRSRRTALLAATALALPLLLVSLPTASATITGSSFEANDGNLVVDTNGQQDWATVTPFHAGIDLPTGKKDDSFKGGVDEDTVNPAVGTGAIPNSKDDLARFYLSFAQSSVSTDQLLYLAWIRNKTSGSADMDFELNQSTTTTSDGLPTRSLGDLLVTYEFISTKTPEIRIQRWITSGTGCVAAAAPPCWANRVLLDNTNSEAKVNDGFAVQDPGRYLTPNKVSSLPSQTFGEAAINLTTLRVFTSGTCTRFARAFAKSRSSQSFNSSMQDLIKPIGIDFSNCLTKSFDITVPHGVPTGTTLYGVFTTPDGVTQSAALAPGTTAGHLVGSSSTVPPGAQITDVHLELRTASGAVVWRNTGQTETIGESTTNTGAFDYGLTLTPASATNFTGRPHTLTATATGTGSLNGTALTTAGLRGLPVGFRLESGTPSGCGALSPNPATTGTTDATAGIATTVLTSAAPCTTTIRAFLDKAGSTAGYDSNDVSATASKTFENYRLAVSPGSARNVLGAQHTFTVTLTRSAGGPYTGYQTAAGNPVRVSLIGADGPGAYIVSINGVASPANTTPTTGDCPTSSSGTCTVVATAARTGTFSLAAQYGTSNQSGAATFDGNGSKTYLDYRVTVTPETADNEVGVPHTFTALLEQSVNDVWSPVPGKVLALTLDRGASDATITSILAPVANPDPAAPRCTTRSDGTCAVTVSASTPGTVRLTATYKEVLDSGELVRSDVGTKHWYRFTLSVTHVGPSLNNLNEPHTFLVTLKRFDGTNTEATAGYPGQVVRLALDQGGTDATITSIVDPGPDALSCTTRADGTCAVSITSSQAGQVTLTATYSAVLSSNSTVNLNANAVKRYLDLTIGKTSCASFLPVGGSTTFTIPYAVNGTSLTRARITDTLPSGFTYVSATPTPTDVSPGANGTTVVVWDLGTLADGTASQLTLNAVANAAGSWVNTGVLTADEGVSKAFASAAVIVGTSGATASGSAYGVTASLLGSTVVEPQPVAPAQGAASLASFDLGMLMVPVLTGNVGLLEVTNDRAVTSAQASDEASATTANVDVIVAGIRVRAQAVSARSASLANGGTATSSTAGSVIVGLTITGGLAAPGAPALPTNATVSEPGVYSVVNLAGEVVQIHVLEKASASGAAAGIPQPTSPAGAPRQFASGEGINGLRVNVLAGTAQVVVSHAESQASFPAFDQCGTGTPYVLGNAAVVDKDTVVDTDVTTVRLVPVELPSTGGDVVRSLNRTELGLIGLDARTAFAETHGGLSPLQASSKAGVVSLALPGLTADAVKVTAGSIGGALSGDTEIAKLFIGTTNVCATLMLTATCHPAPNTPLIDATGTLVVVLNEQVASGNTITVTAVHVYVLGSGNPLGLPVGSDLAISTATAGTSS